MFACWTIRYVTWLKFDDFVHIVSCKVIKLVHVKNNWDESNNRSTHFRDGQPQVQETYYPQTVISIYQFSDNKEKHIRFYAYIWLQIKKLFMQFSIKNSEILEKKNINKIILNGDKASFWKEHKYFIPN